MWQTVRMFWIEPAYCDLPTMTWNISVLLRMLALNIESSYTKRIPLIFYIWTMSCAVVYYYAYLVSMLWFILVRCPDTGDRVAAMVVMSLGVSSEIATMKLMFMFCSVNKIRRMVDEYLECDALTTPGSRFARNLSRSLVHVKRRAVFFWVLLMVNAVAYVLAPVFQSGRHLIEDLYIIYGLEPVLESPNYEISNLIMASCVMFVCFAAANITTFIIIVAGYTEAQMLSLSEELCNVWEDAVQEYYIDTVELKKEVIYNLYQNGRAAIHSDAKVKINIGVRKRLVQLIQNHARNIRLLKQVEDVFRLPIAIGFLCLSIGLIAELLGGLENTFLQIPFTVSQVAMDCYTGQKVIDASVTFERAVYDCKWENFDKDNMSIVLLMLQSSQKTLNLSAGGMTMLSFSCLMSILRSVYSSFTTLRTMIMKPD